MLAACLAVTPLAAAQTLYVAGTRQWGQSATVAASELALFGGELAVEYPRELAPLIGTETLDKSVAKAVKAIEVLDESGDTIIGTSQGAVAVEEVKHYYATHPDKAPEDLTFITYGDPSNTDGGLLTKLPFSLPGVTKVTADDETQYDTTTVAIQYDLISDSPDVSVLQNPVAWVNAALGGVYYHSTYGSALLDDPTNIVTTTVNSKGATNTHILVVKAGYTPIVKTLVQLHVVDKRLADKIDPVVKKVVDSGYKRATTSSTTPATEAATTASSTTTASEASSEATSSSEAMSRHSKSEKPSKHHWKGQRAKKEHSPGWHGNHKPRHLGNSPKPSDD